MRALGILAALLALSVPAVAGEKVYTVGSGDSASSIADKYYGDVKLGDFLLRYNGKAGTVIHSGEKIKVPYCEVHKVGKGDTWGTLATRYLGRTSAHAAVASLNGFAAGEALPAGESIVIPVVLPWRLERGESLASLAGVYYGDPNRADLLQEFNDVEDPRRLSVGETVKIPLTSIRLHRSKAAELPLKQPAPVRLAKTAPKDPPATATGAAKTSQSAPATPSTASKAPPQSAPAEAKKPPEKTATAPPPPKPDASNRKHAAEGGNDEAAATRPGAGAMTSTSAKASPAAGDDKAAEKAVAPQPKAPVPEPDADKTRSQGPELVAGKAAGSAAAAPVEVPQVTPTVKTSPRFEKYIREAARSFADGEYARARLLLESLREKSRSDGTDEERAEILRLLAFVYVAFDMRAEACSAFQSLPPQPAPALDPDLVSPRIRDALARCPGRHS